MLALCRSCSCTPRREGFTPCTTGLARKALPCTHSLREPRVSPPLFLIGGLICSCRFQINCRISGLMWLNRWVSDLFTCCWVCLFSCGFDDFFWIYGFDLLEVSVENRDFVCILSIGLLNVSYFSVWFERKS